MTWFRFVDGLFEMACRMTAAALILNSARNWNQTFGTVEGANHGLMTLLWIGCLFFISDRRGQQ